MSESVKISLRLPQDLLTWIDGEVARKREKGLKSSTTDEIMTCIVHRIISRLPPGKQRNLCKAMGGAAEEVAAADMGHDEPSIEQPELMDVIQTGA